MAWVGRCDVGHRASFTKEMSSIGRAVDYLRGTVVAFAGCSRFGSLPRRTSRETTSLAVTFTPGTPTPAACRMHQPTRHMERMFVFATISLVAVMACGNPPQVAVDAASSGDAEADARPAEADARPAESLSQLPLGNHLGMQASYELLPTGTAAALAARQQEAVAAGMKVARVHVSWGELEPTAGQFDLSSLTDGLSQTVPADAAVLLLLETIDSESFQLPRDLIDPERPYRLAQDRRFDDPVVLARFDALIEAVLPVLAGRRVFAIAVGNEPDNFLDDVAPSSEEGRAWVAALAGFTMHARDRFHARLPGVAVGMTLRQKSIERGIDTLGSILEASDVAIFNYYCQDEASQIEDAARVGPHLDQLLAAAGELPVVLQELGCPAGPGDSSPSLLAATEAKQAAYLAAVASRMRSEPRLRAAFWFTGVDWSPALTAITTDALRDAGYPELAAQFEESLRSCGLLRYEDGSIRPSWSELVAAIGSLRGS